MKGVVKLAGDVRFNARSGTGHDLVLDGAPESGGLNQGMRPMEAVLLGMGGCTAYDVAQILRKQRVEVELLEVEMDAERAEDVPKVFTRIHLTYRAGGAGITQKGLDRAIGLSIEKYCSATKMISSTATVTYDTEIVEP